MTIVGSCPVDGSTDVYELVVTASRTIPVEQIIKAVHKAVEDPLYQEDVALFIAATLKDVEVRLSGRHSGVKTVVTVTS